MTMPNAVLAWDAAALAFANTGDGTVHGALSVDAQLAVTGPLVAQSTSQLVGDVTTGRNMSVGGQVAIGSPSYAPASASLYILRANTVDGAYQYGIRAEPAFTSTATSQGAVVQLWFQTAAATFTMGQGYGLHVYGPSIGAGSSVTTIYGLYVDNQGGGGRTNAYGIYIANQSGAATTNIGLYNAATSWLVGTASISTLGPSANTMLYVNTSVSGAGQWCIYCQPTFSASATIGYGLHIWPSTATATFTMANLYGIMVSGPSMGAGSSITRAYGLYVDNQGGAGRTYAYGIYINSQSGAATTNIGFFNAATSQFNGPIGIGSAPGPSAYLFMFGGGISGSTQWGANFAPIFQSSATNQAFALSVTVNTAAATFTLNQAFGLNVNTPSLGAGNSVNTMYGLYVASQGNAAVTNAYGIYIASQSGAVTNAYGIYINSQSGAATTNIGLFNGGTSQLNGPVGIGTGPQPSMYLFVWGGGLSGSTQWGANFAPIIQSSAQTAYAVSVTVNLASATFTLNQGFGLNVNGPSFGSGSTVNTMYGLYIANQANVQVTNAYGIYIANQSGAATTNIGLYNEGSTRLGGNIGFFGAAPAGKPNVSGARGGNAALASLLTALAGLGLVTDSTSA